MIWAIDLARWWFCTYVSVILCLLAFFFFFFPFDRDSITPRYLGGKPREILQRRAQAKSTVSGMKTLTKKRIWQLHTHWPLSCCPNSSWFIISVESTEWIRNVLGSKLCLIFLNEKSYIFVPICIEMKKFFVKSPVPPISVFLRFCDAIHLTCENPPLQAYGLNSLCYSKSLMTYLISSCKNVTVMLCFPYSYKFYVLMLFLSILLLECFQEGEIVNVWFNLLYLNRCHSGILL